MMKKGFVKKGFLKETDGSGGGGAATDIKSGYCLVRNTSAVYGGGNNVSIHFYFKKDRSKVFYAYSGASGSNSYIRLSQYLPNVNGGITETTKSTKNINIGQSYKGGSNTYLSLDAKEGLSSDGNPYVITCLANNFSRTDFDAALNIISDSKILYTDLTSAVMSAPIIISDTKFAAYKINLYDGLISIYDYSDPANIVKTNINIGRNYIKSIEFINGLIAVCSSVNPTDTNYLSFINPNSGEVVYEEVVAGIIQSMISADNYLFTLNTWRLGSPKDETPISVYSVANNIVSKLILEDLTGLTDITMQNINVIKDDNRGGNVYLCAFGTSNNSCMMLYIDIDNLTIGNISLSARMLTGNSLMGGNMPAFVSGNFVAYNTITGSNPTTGEIVYFKYEYEDYSIVWNGKKYLVSEDEIGN